MLSDIETRTGATLRFFAVSFRIFIFFWMLGAGLRYLNAKGDSNSGWLESFQRLWDSYQGWFRIFLNVIGSWFGNFPKAVGLELWLFSDIFLIAMGFEPVLVWLSFPCQVIHNQQSKKIRLKGLCRPRKKFRYPELKISGIFTDLYISLNNSTPPACGEQQMPHRTNCF